MTRFQQRRVLVCRPQFALAAWLGAFAAPAFARVPTELPEPSMLSLLGIAVVAGIVAYRIKNKK